jgi:hypothetical protein
VRANPNETVLIIDHSTPRPSDRPNELPFRAATAHGTPGDQTESSRRCMIPSPAWSGGVEHTGK